MQRSSGLRLVLRCTVLLCLGGETRAADPSRQAFAEAMRRIRIGMTMDEVRQVLGKPDQVRDEDLDTHMKKPALEQVWCYGTSEKNGFPTLGRVYFERPLFSSDQPRPPPQVVHLCGDSDPQPAIAQIEERECRRLLTIVGAVPECDPMRFNPLPMIRAVNALQAIGKRKAAVVVEEYLRVSPFPEDDFAERALLILRTLCELPQPAGYLPLAPLGAADPPPPDDPRVFPRFPIVVIHDIPLLLPVGFVREGRPIDMAAELRYFREELSLRERPLIPTNRPLEVLAALEKPPAWTFEKPGAFARAALAAQLLRLVNSVSGNRSEQEMAELAREMRDGAKWQDFVKRFSRVEIRWDSSRQDFVEAARGSTPDVDGGGEDVSPASTPCAPLQSRQSKGKRGHCRFRGAGLRAHPAAQN